MPELKNRRHESFCKEYHRNGFNGLQAYKKAYQCSDKVAHKRASVLLAKIGIQARIAELGKKAAAKYGIDIEELINDLKDLKNEGKIKDRNIAIKSIDMLLKVGGGYDADKGSGEQLDITIKLV